MCVWERSTEKLFKKRNANTPTVTFFDDQPVLACVHSLIGTGRMNTRGRALKTRDRPVTRIRPQEGPYGGGPCMGIRGPECCMPKLLKQRGSSLFSFLMPGDSAAVAFSPHRLLDVLATAVYLAFVLDERLQDTRGSGRASCP